MTCLGPALKKAPGGLRPRGAYHGPEGHNRGAYHDPTLERQQRSLHATRQPTVARHVVVSVYAAKEPTQQPHS